jgi:CheY-like chemotaxis protein
VKYNRSGGRVDVTCERLNGRVRISVSDTGYGIPADRLQRMFTPFDRLGAEQSNVEGTGLGLALSKRLAEALGGALTVASVPGQGSTFVLELQAADAPTPETPASHMASTRAEATAGDVLYIEDNMANVRLMERIIARRPGVQLRHAPDGAAGLRLVEEHRPHLVLLDLHLPDMRGEEVLHRLRGMEHTAGIPVAILSADATPAQKRRLLSMGASVYMSKPLNVTQVLELVDSVLPQGSRHAG